MATNSKQSEAILGYIIANWYPWYDRCSSLMLGYNDWRMRCYSETLKTLDCRFEDFKTEFDFVWSVRGKE